MWNRGYRFSYLKLWDVSKTTWLYTVEWFSKILLWIAVHVRLHNRAIIGLPELPNSNAIDGSCDVTGIDAIFPMDTIVMSD